MNSLPKTVTQKRYGCDLNPGPSAPESSTLTTRPPSHPSMNISEEKVYQLTYHQIHEWVFPFERLASAAEKDLQHVWTDMDCCRKKISPIREYHTTN